MRHSSNRCCPNIISSSDRKRQCALLARAQVFVRAPVILDRFRDVSSFVVPAGGQTSPHQTLAGSLERSMKV